MSVVKDSANTEVVRVVFQTINGKDGRRLPPRSAYVTVRHEFDQELANGMDRRRLKLAVLDAISYRREACHRHSVECALRSARIGPHLSRIGIRCLSDLPA